MRQLSVIGTLREYSTEDRRFLLAKARLVKSRSMRVMHEPVSRNRS
jgi:hypothetical protein